jgi:hypothetical protein
MEIVTLLYDPPKCLSHKSSVEGFLLVYGRIGASDCIVLACGGIVSPTPSIVE